jgi:hypothetical protein
LPTNSARRKLASCISNFSSYKFVIVTRRLDESNEDMLTERGYAYRTRICLPNEDLLTERGYAYRTRICLPNEDLLTERGSAYRTRICLPNEDMLTERGYAYRTRICLPNEDMLTERDTMEGEKLVISIILLVACLLTLPFVSQQSAFPLLPSLSQ